MSASYLALPALGDLFDTIDVYCLESGDGTPRVSIPIGLQGGKGRSSMAFSQLGSEHRPVLAHGSYYGLAFYDLVTQQKIAVDEAEGEAAGIDALPVRLTQLDLTDLTKSRGRGSVSRILSFSTSRGSNEQKWIASGIAVPSGGPRPEWTVFLLTMSEELPVEKAAFPGHGRIITDLAWVLGKQWLLSVSTDRSAHLWDVGSVRPRPKREWHLNEPAMCCDSRRDSVIVGTSSSIQVYSLDSYRRVKSVSLEESATVVLVDPQRDERFFAGDGDGFISLWDLRKTQGPVSKVQFYEEVHSIVPLGSNGFASCGSGEGRDERDGPFGGGVLMWNGSFQEIVPSDHPCSVANANSGDMCVFQGSWFESD